jgi:chromate transporter
MELISLSTIFWIFLRLGAIGFGGPIALVSLMEQECSKKRKWLTLEEFNERYVFCKLLPGPIASQMALWMGLHVRGRIGGLVAGAAFLLPSFTLIFILSIFYSSVQGLPRFTPIIQGMEAGAIVVIFDSVMRMFRPYYRQVQPWIFMLMAAPLMLVIPRWEPLIILSGGLAYVMYKKQKGFLSISPVLLQIFWVHFKAGFTVFGTGLAIVPVLQHEVVEVYKWMSTPEFLDGIAFGQITPGPVTISSVFIGYKTAGVLGGILGFLGMYTPGVILIFFVMPFLFSKLKGKPFVAFFQQGAIPTVIGCILGATILLGRTTITSPVLAVLVLVLGILALKFKLPGWGTILLGSFLNFAYSLL